MPTDSAHNQPRRRFLQSAAGGIMILKSETAFGSQANSTVEVGIIGCGGRGNWIGPFFPEFAGARIVALADVVKSHLDSTRETFKVEPGRAYYGPDAYRELANSSLDAVVIESPPYFHPAHAAAAVEAGKHVYLAKPVAVDVPGCKSILTSGNKAEGKVSFLVDFQTRAQPVYQEAARRVHRGDIGAPAFTQVYYHAGRPAKDRSAPGMDPGQARVLNFYFDRAIGGDIIVEQNIHVIDVANWFLQGRPLRATGTGGRTDWSGTDYDAGDAWDHFQVTFWYPDGKHADFNSHQLTRTLPDLCVRSFGVDGCVDSHYGGSVRILGKNEWLGAEKDPTFKDGAVNNVKAFIESIRTGKLLNNTATAVESNLTAILGRMAAYGERVVTWEQMLESNEQYQVDLKLRW